MKQNCIILIFLFFVANPLAAQKEFEGVLTYEAGDMLRDVKPEWKSDWMSDVIEAYKVYIKGDKIIVKFAYADAGVPEEEEFMFYEYIDLKRKKYYKVAEPRVPDNSESSANKKPKLKIIEEKKLKKIQPDIKKVTLLDADTTTSEDEAAALYRIDFDCEDCFSQVWVAKEKDVKIKHYPPIAYTFSAMIMSSFDEDITGKIVDQKGFYFADFSPHFESAVLELHVSLESLYKELHRKNPESPKQEGYNVLRLVSIEEKELPDSLFELDLE
ncbi:MAG: hypothetical protein JJT94_15340 [Bernardetiaceae bacterium]|nr:hypothetical protein [Bernardetiaceae bacterium]